MESITIHIHETMFESGINTKKPEESRTPHLAPFFVGLYSHLTSDLRKHPVIRGA